MKYQGDIRKEAKIELERAIAFNKGKWTDRDILCYRTAFYHGLGIAMQSSCVPERRFKDGKQIN